jgi:hypothetical protein
MEADTFDYILTLSSFMKIGVITTFTLFTCCYIIGVSQKHIEVVPLISDCGMYTPEKYLFHVASVLSSVALSGSVTIIHVCDEAYHSRKALIVMTMGSIGLLALGSSTMLENPLLHQAGGLVFILCYGSYFILFTYYSKLKQISPTQLNTRYILTAFNCCSLLTFLVLHIDYGRFVVYISMSEWIFLFTGLLYFYFISYEFSGIYLTFSKAAQLPPVLEQ